MSPRQFRRRIDTTNPRRTARFIRPLFLFLVPAALLAVVFLVRIVSLHHRRIASEDEAPLDHVLPTALKPFYGLVCPDRGTKECRYLPGESPPKIFMIGARSETTFDTWSRAVESDNRTKIEFINTFEMSRGYNNTRCQRLQWHNRLTFVYQRVFRRILDEHDDPGFVFVEDDVVLVDWTALKDELCLATSHEFYSFFRSKAQGGTCLYEHGTVAFYVQRSMMHRIVKLDDATFCRLPIDMYIAKSGPWYSTTRQVVRHVGKRVYVER